MNTDTTDATDDSLIAMHEFDDVTSLSEEILLAIDEIDDRDHEQRRPFCTYLDPDALDALFVPEDDQAHVEAKLSFEYEGVRVDVDTTGSVLVVQVS